MDDTSYSLIVVGTGFASTFFLHRFLERAPESARVLVLERGEDTRGKVDPAAGQSLNRWLSTLPELFSATGTKTTWVSNVAFGGGSNCWMGQTPRFMPSDFRMRSEYGVGVDWPIGYDDLADYYEEVEALMKISGPETTPFPRRGPYPLPPHTGSAMDALLARKHPRLHVPAPTARASVRTPTRPACCGARSCRTCPVGAKFMIPADMPHVYGDARVTLKLRTEAVAVEIEGGRATGARFRVGERESVAKGEIVALGAHAIFNPYILMRSGVSHHLLGAGLSEQHSVTATVLLRGVDGFAGSTLIPYLGYMLYDGPHRAQRAGCLIESLKTYRNFRRTPGRRTEKLDLVLIYEDLPDTRNYVGLGAAGKPSVHHGAVSDYARLGVAHARADLLRVLDGLPVESVEVSPAPRRTDFHVLGTHRMGRTAGEGVVAPDLRIHGFPNLLALGSGSFPTGSPANPTLTLSALSLRAADKVLS